MCAEARPKFSAQNSAPQQRKITKTSAARQRKITNGIVRTTMKLLLMDAGVPSIIAGTITNPNIAGFTVYPDLCDEEAALAEQASGKVLAIVKKYFPLEPQLRLYVHKAWIVTEDNAYREFSSVKDQIFRQPFTWGDVMGFIGFCWALSVYTLRLGIRDKVA